MVKNLGFRERRQVFREKARDFDKGGATRQGPRSRELAWTNQDVEGGSSAGKWAWPRREIA